MEEGMVGIFLFLIAMTVTGYCDQTGAPPYQGITASGMKATEITMACPPEMPFGTVILMDGRIFLCMDRGPAIKDNHLDRWFPTCIDAILWGVQEKRVFILNESFVRKSLLK